MKRHRKFRLKPDPELVGRLGRDKNRAHYLACSQIDMLLESCVEPAIKLLQGEHLRLPGPAVAALLRVRAAQFEAGDAELEARVVAAELLMHHNLAVCEDSP